jgi:hypothetical protein
VLEALDRLRARTLVDYMRIRAFPFWTAVRAFIERTSAATSSSRIATAAAIVVALETGIARDAMTSILDYGGLPLTAIASFVVCWKARGT